MEPQLLPVPLWQELLPWLKAYLAFSRAQPRQLSEREAALRQLCSQLCGVLLRADARAEEEQSHPGACACGGRFRSHGWRKRRLATLVGEVVLSRRYYRCSGCGRGVVPLDERWGLEGGCLSPEAKALAVDLATALPFRESGWWLARLGGLPVSVSTLWRVTQEAGARRLAELQAQEQERRSRSGAAAWVQALRRLGSSERWCLAVDGVLVRVSGEWREAKVAVLGPLGAQGQWLRGRVSYLASLVPAEAFRLRVVRHGLSRGVTQRTALVLVSDGAAWIQRLRLRHYPQAVVVRDWWHAVGYLWRGSQALFGEGSRKAARLVEELKGFLWQGEVEEVRDRLLKARAQRRALRPPESQAFREACSYLEHQEAYLRYDEYRDAHWPLGSGPAEAACKTVVQARMKRSGMNWSPQGAEHLLLLRADYCARLQARLYQRL